MLPYLSEPGPAQYGPFASRLCPRAGCRCLSLHSLRKPTAGPTVTKPNPAVMGSSRYGASNLSETRTLCPELTATVATDEPPAARSREQVRQLSP
ncbi:hypothetical protein NDU88_006303 [Pleurodeles waltl]|uniref:Uncharacterized protein n=1 Tax=Pleurodeles waltl TaxID=8319 RepID=A0AAV7VLL4_PLEWA|nr:hypothetical protein NDU88_006303 [Pleurodeles waltl]